jgi:chorismate mutase
MDTLSDPRTDAVSAGRERIDRLDAELVRLIAERAAVSAEVQAARRAAGGPRIVQSRENEVVGRWHSALGRPGSAIALALLELGRGPR